MPYNGCSALHRVNPNFKKCVSLGQLAGKKSPNMPNQEQEHFGRSLSLQFNTLHSMRSHSYLKAMWVIPVLEYLRNYNNLEKLPASVLISIDLPIWFFSTFRASNYYSIMESMNNFGQVVLEILENNLLKSFWKLRNRDFILISWNFLREEINLAKSCFFKKTLKCTDQ